ncbi:PrpF domain-containing protein [Streptomyces sp. PTD9-10]|uniref:PrpF domain-containing protein n=1 Tax=Streptomyces sp. PTD9-10 TaxID=3120151 RepID=UPI003FCD673C
MAAGLRLPGGVGEGIARPPGRGDRLRIEHPTGFLDVATAVDPSASPPTARRTAVVRTARKIIDGIVFPRAAAPAAVQPLGGNDGSAAR